MSLKKYIAEQKTKYEARRWLSNDPVKTAAYCLFHLNRHVRVTQRKQTKTAIYQLKTELVKWLYQNGYCVSVTRKRQTLKCWHTWEYNEGGEGYCERCDNTGIYREHVLYHFVFAVGGQYYTWHQPDGLVNFEIKVADDSKWFDDLPEYKQSKSGDTLILDQTLLKLYTHTVCQFLKMQGASVDLPAVTLKESLLSELECQSCGGYGYTESRRWNGYGHNVCWRCHSMGYRFGFVNRTKLYYFRIFRPHYLAYDYQEMSVPWFLGPLMAWQDRKRKAAATQRRQGYVELITSEDDVPL